MTDLPLPAQERHRVQKELVEVLAQMDVMQQADSRQQLVRSLRNRIAHQRNMNDAPNPRHQSVEIVDTFFTVPHELVVLVEVLELFDPAAVELTDIQRLRHEADVLEVLDVLDWSELRSALLSIPLPAMSRIFQRSLEHALSAPPLWCATAWDVFVYLTGQNAPPGGLPPSMLFLVFLEQEVEQSVAALIRRRNQRRASELGVTTELDRRRAVVNTGNDLLQPYVYVVIQVESDLEPSNAEGPDERYIVTHFRQWHDGDAWRSRFGGRFNSVRYVDLETTVEKIIRDMEVEWSDRRDQVVVELVLPLELLNEDAAWWCVERATIYLEQKVLAMDYSVVVRSLDRLRQPAWHRAWRMRWDRLKAEPTHTRLYRSLPTGIGYYTRLEADLNSDLRWTTLLLSEPPMAGGNTGFHEVMTALRAGIPAIVWHRTRPADEGLWEEVSTMTAEGRIGRLPAHARRKRLEALKLEPADRDQHTGRHLVVLWDDPERKPELNHSDPSD